MPLIAGGVVSSVGASASAQPAGPAAAALAPSERQLHRRAYVMTGDEDSANSDNGEVGRERRHLVQLALTPIVSVPGARAYHSSVLVDGTEYWFSEAGVGIGHEKDVIKSHARCLEDSEVIDLGLSARTGQEMVDALRPHFRRGTYDMLMKNCNAWSDCCIWFLLRRRLNTGYVMLDRIAAGCPKLSLLFLKGDYLPNPRAANFDVELLIRSVTELYGHSEEEPTYNSSGFGASASWFACMPACMACVQSNSCSEKIVETLPVLLGTGGHNNLNVELAPVNWQDHDTYSELCNESTAPRNSQIARPVEIINASRVSALGAVHKVRRHEKVPRSIAVTPRQNCSHELLPSNIGAAPAENMGQEERVLSRGAASPCDEALSASTRSALSRLAAKFSEFEERGASGEEQAPAMAAAAVAAAAGCPEGTSGSEDEDEEDEEEDMSTGTDESSLPSGSVDLDERPSSGSSSAESFEWSPDAPAALQLERGASRRSLKV